MTMFSTVMLCNFCEVNQEEVVCFGKTSICRECIKNATAVFARRMNTNNFQYREKPSIFR